MKKTQITRTVVITNKLCVNNDALLTESKQSATFCSSPLKLCYRQNKKPSCR